MSENCIFKINTPQPNFLGGKTSQPKSYQYLSTVCGLICACCPAPLCYKEGTIFRRRGPRRENDSFEQDQNSASAARTAPSSRFQSQFLQVSLPPGEVSFQKQYR